MQDKKTVRESRVWICDDGNCSCEGAVTIMSYQDLIDCGIPICEGGLDMVQLSGVGHDLDTDTIDREIESYKIIRSYDEGLCPDCGVGIPNEVVQGQACFNCGHIFLVPEEAL